VSFYRYVIIEKGKIEIGILSCALPHTSDAEWHCY